MFICLLLLSLLHLAGFMGCLQGLRWHGGSVTELWDELEGTLNTIQSQLCATGRDSSLRTMSPIHTCPHPVREKCSLSSELSLNLLPCFSWLFWAGLGVPCTQDWACQHPEVLRQCSGGCSEMQPKGLCNSSSLSAGWVGVRTEALGRKPVVWESGACLGWELQRFPELLARLPLQPRVNCCACPGLCSQPVQWDSSTALAQGAVLRTREYLKHPESFSCTSSRFCHLSCRATRFRPKPW